MVLYCISLFLNSSVLRGIQEALKPGWLDGLTEVAVQDQVGDTASGLQLHLEGLSFLFLPANSFHIHRDFEIGLTETWRPGWERGLKALRSSGLVAEHGTMPEDPDSEFAVLGGPTIHGPFFGIFDGNRSEIRTELELGFRLPEAERAFYGLLKPFVDPRLAESLQVGPADSSLPVFDRLKVQLSAPRPVCAVDHDSYRLTVSSTAFELSFPRLSFSTKPIHHRGAENTGKR